MQQPYKITRPDGAPDFVTREEAAAILKSAGFPVSARTLDNWKTAPRYYANRRAILHLDDVFDEANTRLKVEPHNRPPKKGGALIRTSRS